MGDGQESMVAVIGVAGIFAQADSAEVYWDNILNKIDCITDVPPSRWRVEDYYDPDPMAPDKVYCKRGGFLPDIDFNPLEFGIPPNILEVTDVSQLLSLVVARDVLHDAGYADADGGTGGARGVRGLRSFDRSRVGVVLGVAGGQKLITPLTSRLQYPVWERVLKSYDLPEEMVAQIVETLKMAYVEWNENAFPGLLGNVIAGRIANRFDLGGMNSVVDAACASSLSAIHVAVNELVAGRAEMMISGGVDTDNSPFTYMCFSKTPAFSKGKVPRPFDVEADGMMVGEGIGMLLLKRLADAERDGDHIYAVIRGIGASSDGRYRSIYAPRPEGQALALRRAYENAGIAPLSIGLIEAHGTGTRAGDPAEFAGLSQVFGLEGAAVDADIASGPTIALGSVKSQIGHTKAAAGAAGMIKAALALDQKVLPPTINVDTPNPALGLETSPFYINTELRPWIKPGADVPRRAGVSAFGFGGTNFHVVLEEYGDDVPRPRAYRWGRVVQPIMLWASEPAALLEKCEVALADLSGDDAFLVWEQLTAASRAPEMARSAARLGFVADGPNGAVALLDGAVKMLRARPDAAHWEHPKGITYRRSGLDPAGGVVALFPGQGAQYVNMGCDLAVAFPPLRSTYADMDARFAAEGQVKLSTVVFPPPAFDDETAEAQSVALRATDYAQAGIGVFSAGLFRLLATAGFAPDFTAGHSFGELTALWAGGVLDDDDFMRLVKARGKAMRPPADQDFDAGSMAAVQGALQDVAREVAAFEDVVIANQNSNHQVVLAGPTDEIRRAVEVLTEQGFKATQLPVSAAFHTPLVGHASAPFAEAVSTATFHQSDVAVYSNTTGMPYPEDPAEARALLADHILHPVLFKQQIEAIYDAGGRIFVECGPRRITTGLVEDILTEKVGDGGDAYVVIPLNASRRVSSDRQFREAVVKLRVVGLSLDDVDPWERRRTASG